MPAISRAQMQRQLVTGLNALWGLEYKQYPEEWRELFNVETSDKAFEENLKLSGFGQATVKPEGQALKYDTIRELYPSRFTHQTVAMGFIITEEAIEDNLYMDVGRRYTKAMARSMAYTKNIRAMSVINNAFDTNFKGGDQVPLASASHPLGNGGTLSNTAATDLNETSLEAALIQISKWTNDRGLLIQARAKRLVVPTDLMFVAERLLKTPLRVGTNNNDINAIKSMGAIPDWTVNHFITDTNAWAILTDIPDGLTFYQRTALKTSSEGDFDTGNMKYKARERYSYGWTDPLSVFISSGA